MDLHWHYNKTAPFFAQGADTTRPNFSREERSQVGILIREALQNPLDIPRDDLVGPIHVVVRQLRSGEFDVEYLDDLFTPEFRQRLKSASGVDLPPAKDAEIVVIEDFGTKGLVGDVDDDDADGPEQNWNAFWHREGEGAKGRASNGGAGQGKVTYYAQSYASTVLGLTFRSTDAKTLLMGRASFLRDYPFVDGHKYYRNAYWTVSDKRPTPETRPEKLQRFADAFRLERASSSSGLSLVIPFARPFDLKEAVKSVILDFYMPVARNRLQVTVGKTKISSDTIDEIANRFITDEEVAASNSSFSKAYRAFARQVIANPVPKVTLPPEWNKDRTIPKEAISERELAELRELLSSGRPIAIRLPLKLKRKNGALYNTSFDVYLQAPPDLERNEEAFVRRDLLIGAESHLNVGSFVQKTRSLTWIQDRHLSDFLLTAEEPTHLVWNASKARDKGEYVSPDLTLRSIRQAVPRLLSLLIGGNATKDYRSLARYFSKPAEGKTPKRGNAGPAQSADVTTNPAVRPPPPSPKPFRLDWVQTTLRMVPTKALPLEQSQLPLRVTVELAYEGLDDDPFEAYDPYDFDISDADLFPIRTNGMNVISREGNRLVVEVRNSSFLLEISGFDPHVRTRARLTYNLPIGRDDAMADDTSEEPAS